MKAIVLNEYGTADNFAERTDLPVPVPHDNEVLVRIKATGFNPIDYQTPLASHKIKNMNSPILGVEFSGIVIKSGKYANKFKKAAAVIAASGNIGSNGTYAEYICVPECILASKPAKLTFEEAAAVPLSGLLALQTYKRLKPAHEDKIFVAGDGGIVEQALIKLLLYQGINKLIVIVTNNESRNQLITAGVPIEQIVDYNAEDMFAKIIIANKQFLFNHCVDLVGGSLSELCAQLLITNGTYVDVAARTSPQAREILFDKGATILNISSYAYALNGELDFYGTSLEEISTLLEQGIISPPPIKVVGDLSVETVKNAHDILERNLSKGKKLVMQIPAVSFWISFMSKVFLSDFVELYKNLHVVK